MKKNFHNCLTIFSQLGDPGNLQLPLPLESPQKPEALINKLLESPDLRGWERLFVATVGKSTKPGSKQLKKIEAIAARLGIEGGEV